MGTKHTPGPWVENKKHQGPSTWRVEVQSEAWTNDGFIIADVWGPDGEANARLIAAAPELLEALDHPLLREVLGFIEDAAPDEVMATLRLWQDSQRAAIAKATQP